MKQCATTAASPRPAGVRQFNMLMLRPFLLTPEHAPADFHTWKEEFASFFTSYGMEYYPLDQQQGLFQKCISSELWENICIQVHTSLLVYLSMSGPSCMRVLEETFWNLYLAFTWRLEYEETSPVSEETLLTFLKRLVWLFKDSDIIEVDEKDQLVYKFLSWYPDPWIRGRIMELKSPVFSDLWRITKARKKQIFADASLTKIAQQKLAIVHSPSPIATVQAALLDGSYATVNEVAVAAAVKLTWFDKEDGGAGDFGHSVSSDHRRSVSSDKVHLKANNWCSDSSVYSTKNKVTGHANKNSHKLNSEVEKRVIGRSFPHESESATRQVCASLAKDTVCAVAAVRDTVCA